ncbi:SMI1/KNR4 family protein [Actinoplanes sp. NBC_00393]|uniref:SMI1/KNR4 family protein n=1 Tax=Actinoplanes sp. NBC_00393 TaxID=2975953 RepID=UPI002E1E4110
MTLDWAGEIDRMVSAKQVLREADQEELWRYEAPNPPATEKAVRQAETAVGFTFDSEYAAFLRHADGWPALLQNTDLFGTADLTGPAYAEALDLLEDAKAEAEGTDLAESVGFPIGASETTIDMFVLLRGKGDQQWSIVWMAGAEVERYDSFPAFFRAMVEHNLREADDFRRRLSE